MRPRILALTVALALAAAVAWRSLSGGPPSPAISETPEAPARAKEEAAPPNRESAQRASVEAPDDAPVAIPLAEIHGLVVDVDGKALPDLRVRELADESDGVRSGPDGSFAIRPASEEWTLAVDEDAWTTVRPASFDDAPSPTGARIVAAKATSVAGVVADRGGRPLPGARVELARDAATWSASAGFEGRFRVEKVPALAGIRAVASLAGWRPAESVLDLPSELELRFVLDLDDPDAPEIEGDVVHADGSPAANALVAFGAARTRTDARGKFRVVCGWFDAETPLVAVERGLEPAVIDGFGARCLPPAPPPEPAHLVLAGRAHAIEGRVVTARGEACKGFDVVLLGTTPLDPGGTSRDVAELEAGGPVRDRTDSDGSFAFGGLRSRPYALVATGRRRGAGDSLVRVDAVPVDGSEVVVTVPDDRERASIRGRVRTLDGNPVAGARVGLGRAPSPGFGGEFARLGGRGATTSVDGRFELADAPSDYAIVVASAEGFLPSRLELAPGTPRDAIELALRVRRSVHVDATRASPAPDAVRALDASDRGVPLWIGNAGSPSPMGLVPLRHGDSGAIGAGDDARTIVLYRGARELARITVAPGTGPLEIVWP